MELPKETAIELTANALLNVANNLRKERRLSFADMDMVLTKVMLDIKSTEMIEQANKVVELTARAQELEEQIKKEKEDKIINQITEKEAVNNEVKEGD